jgi:sec-independent protein translocase protein TatB
MFDISFSELLLCFLVALVVLGPERMPGLARGLGRWTGQARSYMRNLTAELERESQVAEIKRQVADAQQLLREESETFKNTIKGNVDTLKSHVKEIESQGRASAITEALAAPVVSPPETPAPADPVKPPPA